VGYFEMDEAYETGAGRGLDTDLPVASDATACPVKAPRPRAPHARPSGRRACRAARDRVLAFARAADTAVGAS
jgi:hypothetical protein